MKVRVAGAAKLDGGVSATQAVWAGISAGRTGGKPSAFGGHKYIENLLCALSGIVEALSTLISTLCSVVLPASQPVLKDCARTPRVKVLES